MLNCVVREFGGGGGAGHNDALTLRACGPVTKCQKSRAVSIGSR